MFSAMLEEMHTYLYSTQVLLTWDEQLSNACSSTPRYLSSSPTPTSPTLALAERNRHGGGALAHGIPSKHHIQSVRQLNRRRVALPVCRVEARASR